MAEGMARGRRRTVELDLTARHSRGVHTRTHTRMQGADIDGAAAAATVTAEGGDSGDDDDDDGGVLPSSPLLRTSSRCDDGGNPVIRLDRNFVTDMNAARRMTRPRPRGEENCQTGAEQTSVRKIAVADSMPSPRRSRGASTTDPRHRRTKMLNGRWTDR
jgi:hypothetical protein